MNRFDTIPATDENMARVIDMFGNVQIATDSHKRGSRRFKRAYRLADGRWYVRHMNQYHRRFIESIWIVSARPDGSIHGVVNLGPVVNSSRIRKD